MISSRAVPPRLALTITAAAEFCGPFIFGVTVANSIGGGIVRPGYVDLPTIIAALLSAILWSLLTWFLGIPSSSSHAILGGLLGGAIACCGWRAINPSGLMKIILILFTSPIIGFFFGLLTARCIMLLCWNATPKINEFFKKGQIATAVALSLSYGANDAQKSMGIITLALFSSGVISQFKVPIWVVLLCSGMIALGTMVGGWNLIRTLGAKFYRVRPMDGFASQLSSAIVILFASFFGGLVSTTQVVSTAIMGVGSAERMNKVRWGVAKEIVITWLVTIPSTALIGAGMYLLVSRFF
jgi:PiT family inorganic phosphate transporter